MRFLILPVLLMAGAASPAAAQNNDEIIFASGTGDAHSFAQSDLEIDESGAELRSAADQLVNPDMQDNVADTVERVSASLMYVPIGSFAAAIERARPGTVDPGIGYDSRLGDLAGPDAAALPRELGARSREAMNLMGGVAQAISEMMPAFERMSHQLTESFKAAKASARRN